MIEIQALRVGRGDRILFEALDLQLDAGVALHLLGANGAGKTTLLETVAGLRPLQGGRISGIAAGQFHWLGHRDGLALELSPLENLKFWCALNAVPDSRINEALQALDMQRLRFRPCGRLSAGQRRRVALSRLLLQQRALWLLDEPLAALDRAGIAAFEALLTRHLATGGAAIFSSHQPLSAGLAGLRSQELLA